jgi:hypothetical protein
VSGSDLAFRLSIPNPALDAAIRAAEMPIYMPRLAKTALRLEMAGVQKVCVHPG